MSALDWTASGLVTLGCWWPEGVPMERLLLAPPLTLQNGSVGPARTHPRRRRVVHAGSFGSCVTPRPKEMKGAALLG